MYFELICKEHRHVATFPSNFINESLLVTKCFKNQKKSKGFGFQKALKNVWKLDFSVVLQEWNSMARLKQVILIIIVLIKK